MPDCAVPGDVLLGIDGGQTATRALIARPDGTILGQGESGPIRHIFSGTGEVTRAALHAAIRSALDEARIEPDGVAVAVCGITGIRSESAEAAWATTMIREVVRPHALRVVPDFVTSLAGAAAGGAGVVVAAGGGSVAYGRTEDGRQALAGGFGYLLGDEGSGYDIGRRAVSAAIRAADGRDRPTALEDVIKGAFDVPDLQEIKRVIYTPDFSRDRLASLAPLVARAADEGDRSAREIMTSAGEELARLAIAVSRRLFESGETVAVYPTGGVFRAGEMVRRPFGETLESAWPEVEVRAPEYPPVMGAVILARRIATGPDSAA